MTMTTAGSFYPPSQVLPTCTGIHPQNRRGVLAPCGPCGPTTHRPTSAGGLGQYLAHRRGRLSAPAAAWHELRLRRRVDHAAGVRTEHTPIGGGGRSRWSPVARAEKHADQ